MIESNTVITNETECENQIINNEKLDETQSKNKRPNKRKQTFERKNIRNIIDEENFGKDAKIAQKAELERLRRVQEKEHNIRLQSLLSDDYQKLSQNPVYNLENFNKFSESNYVKLGPSRLPAASALLSGLGYKKYNNLNKQYRMVSDSNLICFDEIDIDRGQLKSIEKNEVIEISDGEDEKIEQEDLVDQEKVDTLNIRRDDLGRIVINQSNLDEEDYFLSQKISDSIKPHQISGIRFLYDNLVESKKQFKEADGFGCILAHSMGLGKTIQIIGFLDILFRCVNAKSVVVIVPINTIQNWQNEIDHWLPLNSECSDTNRDYKNGDSKTSLTVNMRPFNLFVIRDTNKTIESRHAVIKQWMDQGGVLLIGYEMFRLLVTYRQSKIVKSKKKDKEQSGSQQKKKICIDIELEEKRDFIYQDFLRALINPGPEVIICDEGHRIKNSEASISKALKAVRTHRRVVMTGYPLQNNLTEYWCMVDFVRPNYLGSKHEFNNMFQRPIENGQCVDSTYEDRKLMQGRAHVLHELLEGFVQRRSHSVLKANLPPKWEYVILIKMSPIQRKLYSRFMEQLLSGSLYNWAQHNTLRTYAMCCKIWNHPDILFRVLKEQKLLKSSDSDFDFDIDDELPVNSKSNSLKSKVKHQTKDSKKTPTSQTLSSPVILDSLNEEDSNSRMDNESNNQDSSNHRIVKENEFNNGMISMNKIPAAYMSYASYLENVMNSRDSDNIDPYAWVVEDDWCGPNQEKYIPECKDNSGKMVIFLSLLEESISYGDKMLVFSQSLLTLDLIELFLKQSLLPENKTWEKNRTYFRLDGSTSATERDRMIKSFNESDSEAFLFLLSTRAGCLGINLIGANRVVVFDASWNPCHDCQAVCRVYRYGQQKPSFIYRLVTDNTMEKKIYDRQVTKQGISDRVVDESNPGQQFTRFQVQVLVQYEDKDIPGLSEENVQEIKRGCGEEDPILGRILEKQSSWITKIPFTHESLLIDRKDYRLTRQEKIKAKERYELDKRQSLYYQKNNYTDYYIKATVPINDTILQSRPPMTAMMSSLMGTNGPHLHNQHRFQLNKNLALPSIVRSNTALLREIEQARVRCGYTKNTPGPFPIAVSDDEDNPIVLRKKSKISRQSDNGAPNAKVSLNNDVAKDFPKQTSQFTVKNNPDMSSDSTSDRILKVIKIVATTELNFPATTSITTSQAGQENNRTKITAGEPLEIICTNKGKFLRVSRTGDLFAIKDNNKINKSENTIKEDDSTNTVDVLPKVTEEKDSEDSLQSLSESKVNNTNNNSFEIDQESDNKLLELSVEDDTNCSTDLSKPTNIIGRETLPIVSSECGKSVTLNTSYSTSNKELLTTNPLISSLFSSHQNFPNPLLSICCNCKLNDDKSNKSSSIRGCCGCRCHLNATTSGQQCLIYSVAAQPQPILIPQLFYNSSSLMQPSFVMTGLSNIYCAAPSSNVSASASIGTAQSSSSYDDRNFHLMINSNQNHQPPDQNCSISNNNDRFSVEYLDHSSLSVTDHQMFKNNNPIYSSYEFSDL